MNDSGEVVFRGQAPFHLPGAQSAKAIGYRNNGVTITFSLLRGDGLVPLDVQVTSDVARALAMSLLAAADQADRD